MKFSTAIVAGALAAGVVSAADETREIVTVTVTGSTDTHRYGRFDKTKPATTSTSSGTHKYGRFDKTKPASTSTSSGTHKYGRFDKTKQPLTTTVYVSSSSAVPVARAAVNGSSNSTSHGNGTNHTNGSSSSSADSGAAIMGSTGVTIGFAGAMAAALLLV